MTLLPSDGFDVGGMPADTTELAAARDALRAIRTLARHRIARSFGHPGAWAEVLTQCNRVLEREPE